jgi:hypothetical protein
MNSVDSAAKTSRTFAIFMGFSFSEIETVAWEAVSFLLSNLYVSLRPHIS